MKEKTTKHNGIDFLLNELEQLKKDGFPVEESIIFLADLAALVPSLKPTELKQLSEAMEKAIPQKVKHLQ